MPCKAVDRTSVRWDNITVISIHVNSIHVYTLRTLGKYAVDPPLVAEWLRHSKHRSKQQYASELRNFLRHRESTDCASVSPPELRDYVAGLRTSRRPRAIAALRSFFEFLAEKTPSSRNPTTRLWENVQAAVEERQIRLDLRDAGLEDPNALRWRDVGVMGLLGANDYTDIKRFLPRDAAIMKALFSRLIASIQETPPADLEAYLDSHVVSQK